MPNTEHNFKTDLPKVLATTQTPLPRWWLCALVAAATANPVLGMPVSGRVFVDRNGDGVAQASEPGLAHVAVSDGKEVVLTSKSGEYRLETEPGRFVFVSLPRGYRAAKSFYATPKAGQPTDFPLVEWPESRRNAVRFVQITDIHVAGKEDTVKTFAEDIAEINALRPEPVFVMATGDLVNVGKETFQYENYLRSAAGFRLPLFNLPGNHDAKESMPNYHEYLGPGHYSFNVGDCHLVMLNCLSFDEQQKAWVVKDLKAAPRGATRVFALHYLPTREQVEYLKGMGAAAVLSGHWHGDRVERGLGVLDMNTPPLRFGGIDRHPRGFRVLEVKGGKVTGELRLGGFHHHAVVVSPKEACVAEAGSLPVVVNAYDTRFDVESVECEGAGGHVSLRRASPWSWVGQLNLPAGAKGQQMLRAEIRAVSGETWRAEAAFEVTPQAELGNQTRAPLRLKWVAPTGGAIGLSQPRAGMKCVAVGVDDAGDLRSCGVSAFDGNGRRLWHFATDSAVKNNIAAADGRLFATSVAGWLYALDEASGKMIWKAGLDRQRERWEVAATTVADGLVYAGGQSYIAAFDVGNGRLVWETRHGKDDWWPSCYVRPIVDQGKLLLPTRIGMWAHDAKTGRVLWGLGGKFNGCVVADNTAYVNRNGVLCAVGLGDGKVIWTGKEKIGDTASAPALSSDKLVVGTADGRVGAFSTKDGVVLWTAQTGPSLSSLQPYQRGTSDVNSSPAIVGNNVYVGASDGEIHTLALADGSKLGSYALGAPIASSPIITGDTLYIGAYDGNLYAFAINR